METLRQAQGKDDFKVERVGCVEVSESVKPQLFILYQPHRLFKMSHDEVVTKTSIEVDKNC